ncbi:hypothetical protein ACFL30_00040 [Candidatus Latescibacterota bacterium]
MLKNFLYSVHGIILLCLTVNLSCGFPLKRIRNVDSVIDVSKRKPEDISTEKEANKTIKAYSIDFKVPNPLIGSNMTYRRIDPNHENIIKCRATLLDDISTEADIMLQCFKDSLNDEEQISFRENYNKKNIKDGMFRIRISMESGFSPKSMEPKHWTIYLENSRGIMIEPSEITSSAVTSQEDSVYSEFYRINLPRHLLRRDITLYFKSTTFFGEDLLSKSNPFIVLVIARVKKTLARIAWKTSEFPKK